MSDEEVQELQEQIARLFALVCHPKESAEEKEPVVEKKSKKKQEPEPKPEIMVVSREDARKILLALRYDLDVENMDAEVTLEELAQICKQTVDLRKKEDALKKAVQCFESLSQKGTVDTVAMRRFLKNHMSEEELDALLWPGEDVAEVDTLVARILKI